MCMIGSVLNVNKPGKLAIRRGYCYAHISFHQQTIHGPTEDTKKVRIFFFQIKKQHKINFARWLLKVFCDRFLVIFGFLMIFCAFYQLLELIDL